MLSIVKENVKEIRSNVKEIATNVKYWHQTYGSVMGKLTPTCYLLVVPIPILLYRLQYSIHTRRRQYVCTMYLYLTYYLVPTWYEYNVLAMSARVNTK